MTKVISGMTVNEDQMKQNIGKSYNVSFHKTAPTYGSKEFA